MIKACRKCGESKSLDDFYLKRNACKACERADAVNRMAKRRSTPEGKAAQRAAVKRWKQANPEKVKAQFARFRLRKGMKPLSPGVPITPRVPKIPASDTAFDRKHVRALRIVAQKTCDFTGWTSGEEFAWRYRNEPAFNLRQRMRASARRLASRFGWVPARFGYEARRLTTGVLWQLVGYSPADLKAHLERQFARGMTWERFLAGEIHIDHIRPVSSFDLDDAEQVRACYCLSNLRPAWAKENIRKSNRAEFLI